MPLNPIRSDSAITASEELARHAQYGKHETSCALYRHSFSEKKLGISKRMLFFICFIVRRFSCLGASAKKLSQSSGLFAKTVNGGADARTWEFVRKEGVRVKWVMRLELLEGRSISSAIHPPRSQRTAVSPCLFVFEDVEEEAVGAACASLVSESMLSSLSMPAAERLTLASREGGLGKKFISAPPSPRRWCPAEEPHRSGSHCRCWCGAVEYVYPSL